MFKTQIKDLKTMKARIKEGRTEYTVTHINKELTFLHPAYGPDTYFKVRDSIQNAGLILPTMAETASLLHAAYNSDDKYSNEIKQLIKDRLWTFTGSLYIPGKGAYIKDNPETMEESELVKKLEANDSSVRFVPFGYNIGEMSSLELAKNAFVRALAGDEGAEKLAEVADKFRKEPYLLALTSVNELITRVSVVSSCWSFGHGLGVLGVTHGGWGGRALGVRAKNSAKDI